MSATDDRHNAILAILGGGNAGSPIDMMAHYMASMSDLDRLTLARALVPEYAVVPREPTHAMRRAGEDKFWGASLPSPLDIYRAMLAAGEATP